MANAYDQFSTEDDEILASVLEESLRHYNEVEVHLRSVDEAIEQGPNIAAKTVSSPTIIDLCESPKKGSVVQSRLSHFFKKPINIITCENQTSNGIKHQPNQNCNTEISSLSAQNNDSSLPDIFYKGSDAEGFHLSSGSHFVYPTNFPVRDYQMEIVKTALFHNTLVSLPTGTGKTFIAAVIMYNFYRWYPMGKIIFMAPTRPLVAQQIEACHSIMAIPREMTFEMTGNIPPEQRNLAWKKYRVFFLTPQVLANDLTNNKCPSEMFRCIIVDEAHRATKDYSYAQVLRHLHGENRTFRIVGLSATPGTNVESVIEVIENLNISKLEFRTEESPDVAKYMNKKDVECISVTLSSSILCIRNNFLMVYDKFSRRLKQYRALNGNITNLSKFQLLNARQKFLASNVAREMPKQLVGCLVNDFTICMSLSYALELLTIYGIKAFYMQSLELLENHKCLSNDADLQQILHNINNELKSQDLTWSHPKLFELKKIVLEYFSNGNSESSSKIIIFCQYRLVVVEVFQLLQTFGSCVKPVMFVGQSLKEKGGLPQKKQLEVMTRFKNGDFNVLIATSVAEEGLDIGEVDLIICLEANKSPIKFVQRLGRTGRKRSGKCITLLTEGKEQGKYKSSVSSSKTLVTKMSKNQTILSKLGVGGPRLIPKHINPQRLMVHVKAPEEVLPNKKKQVKKKVNASIMQYTTTNHVQNNNIEELEPDIFQNNKEKPARKSKKRKPAELERIDVVDRAEVESTAEKYTSSQYSLVNLNSSGSNANPARKTDGGECFLEEERAFNEWLLSCEQADSVVMNELFFKLLNLFSGRPASNVTSDENVVLDNVAVGGNVNYGCTSRNDFDYLLTSTEEHEVNEDGAPRGDLQTVGVRDEIRGCYNVAKRDMVQEEPAVDVFALTDSDDLFDGQQFDEHAGFGDVQTTAVERGTSPAIRSGGGCTTGDFAELDEGCPTNGSRSATEENALTNRPKNRMDDMAIERDDDDDVDDEAPLRNSGFEDMFKSQRADKFIEQYCNAVITAEPSSAFECEHPGVDDDDDDVSIGDSPEFFSCKIPNKKRVQTKLTGCVVRAAPAETAAVDLLTPESAVGSPRPADAAASADVIGDSFLSDDHEADLMFLDYRSDGSDEVFTQKEQRVRDIGGGAGDVYTQKGPVGEIRANDDGDVSRSKVAAAGPTLKSEIDAEKAAYNMRGGLLPFNTLKAVNLLKPAFSLKRNTTTTTTAKRQQQRVEEVRAKPAADDVSPVRPLWPRGGPRQNFSQSTPKDGRAARPKRPSATAIVATARRTAGLQSLLTSSSDSDAVFVDDRDSDTNKKMAGCSRRVKNRRRKKQKKKKLLFIDDEANVSYCGDTSAAMAAAVLSDSRSEEDDQDVDEEFDSSFIDDDHNKSEPSTNMTQQYLQSVKSQVNVRGVFKIPHLSTQHYNIDVYSQMVDKNDNSYEEDSFCVRDVSDVNTSSRTTSEEKPTKPKKRKRILSPQSTSDSDSPDQFHRKTMPRKRTKVKMSLDFRR